jgi:antitoxin component of MazEF toxin-antitoxin module
MRMGNSLGVLLPSRYLEELDLTLGDTVEVELQGDMKSIVIKNKKTAPSTDYLDRIVRNAVDKYLDELDLRK